MAPSDLLTNSSASFHLISARRAKWTSTAGDSEAGSLVDGMQYARSRRLIKTKTKNSYLRTFSNFFHEPAITEKKKCVVRLFIVISTIKCSSPRELFHFIV